MSEDTVIFLAEVNSSQADDKSAVQAAVSHSPFVVPEENVAGERGEESPVGGPEGPFEVGGVCETEAGTEVDVEDEDEDVDVGGVDEIGVSGYESEGFTLSEILRRKRMEKKVSEGIVDTAHLPQCEFSNLQQLPLAFATRIFLLASQGFLLGYPTSEEETDRKKNQAKRAPKSPLTAVLESCCSLFYIAGFLVILVAHSLFISKCCRNDSGGFRKRRCVDWRGN